MQQSHLNKIAEAYNKIAEGKEPCPVHEKAEASKVDKKKMHKCTCESFYYKRLQAMNPEMAEMYLEIAEELVDRGYESARLLDNIIESLPKDFTGHEFRSSLAAVNPRLNEAIHTAEKKQARVIAASFVESLKQARKNVGASTCWDGYKAKGTKKKNGRDVPNCVKEGIRDLDPEKGTKERKARLEKKRGMKLDDHPQYKKEVEEAYTVTNADKKGNTKAYQNFKKGMKGKDGQPLYKAADHMKEATYPSDFRNPDGSKRAVAKKKSGMPNAQRPESGKKEIDEGLKQARKNVGADTCWDGYKAKGTKKKNGREVPNCVKEEEITEKKKGLWDNIHAKRKRGEKPAKPGDKDYPKTLNVEAKKNDSYLETDFKKRQANNEKARKDMEKMGTKMKNPHFEDLQPELGYYDVVLQHLDEKYVIESVEEAEEIMMQLTGAQIVEIIDEFMNSKEES